MRRILSIALFSAIVVLAVDPAPLILAFDFSDARRETLARRADPSPELAAFLAGVRERTKRGDSIVLMLPVAEWEPYSRLYFRASYLLAGRTVLPMVDERGTVQRANVERAAYLAAWRVPLAVDAVVWRGHGGVLVRRR